MAPFQASGAGQSIEVQVDTYSLFYLLLTQTKDAYILATVLGHSQTDMTSITHALHVYDAIRRPFAQDIAERSRVSGRHIMLQNNPGKYDFSNIGYEEQLRVLHDLSEVVTRTWEWTWLSTLEDSVEEARRMVQQRSV